MTKSKGIGRGGQRKGAGRPRFAKTRKASYFSTRITQKTRELLEAEARFKGESLSSVAERLLQLGTAQKARNRQPSPTRALTYLIGFLATRIEMESYLGPKYTWHSDHHIFQAFQAAVIELLNRLKPSGEIAAPPMVDGEGEWWLPFKSPQDFGHRQAGRLLLDMQVSHFYEETRDNHELWGEDFSPGDFRDHYALIDARRDLGLHGPIRKLDLGEVS
jgi:hypothetical protein